MTAADRLDEIQARADKATDGPWRRGKTRADRSMIVAEGALIDAVGVVSGEPRHVFTGQVSNLADAEIEATAEFITHARTDVPALVAALRAVLDYVDECEGNYLMRADEIREIIEDRLKEAGGE